MSVELYRESPGKFDSRTLNRKLLVGGLGAHAVHVVGIRKINELDPGRLWALREG